MSKAPYTRVKIFLDDNKIPLQEVADLLNQSVSKIKRKLNGKSDFCYQEVECLCDRYHIKPEMFSTAPLI